MFLHADHAFQSRNNTTLASPVPTTPPQFVHKETTAHQPVGLFLYARTNLFEILY